MKGRDGRGWAYAGAGLGGAVSIAANVAHSYVPPADAPAGWRPEPGAVIGAVFWPVALFVVVEIVARTAWPAGRRWVALRFAGLLPVALVAALVSYRHLSGLLAFYGEDSLTATLGPLAVDGLMLTATGALIASGRRAGVEPAREPAGEPVSPMVHDAPAGEPVSHPGMHDAVAHEPPRDAPSEPPAEPADPAHDAPRDAPADEPVPHRLASVPAAAMQQPRRRVSRPVEPTRQRITVACDAGCGRQVSRATRTRHRRDGCSAAATG